MRIPRKKKSSTNKYHNSRVEYDDIKFDSKKEGQAYLYLKDLLQQGKISNLVLQPKWEIIPSIKEQYIKHLKTKDKVCERTVQLPVTYVADFQFSVGDKTYCFDVKPCKALTTQVFFLKKKLMRYFHGIEVIEIYNISDFNKYLDE
jgi:hypothetical protein